MACFVQTVWKIPAGGGLFEVCRFNFMCFSLALSQLHNEDDPSEGSASAEPSTSSQAPMEGISNAAATDTEAPPPPYASVALGATAAPGLFTPH